ncbi:MAG: hypothetical protein JO340_17220 [Acidobacteriaceae bacterium]|nr:hypothetical protein [Acidobacteriaceae bacterium]
MQRLRASKARWHRSAIGGGTWGAALALLVTVALQAAGAAGSAGTTALPTLTTIQKVRSLKPDQAMRRYPVRVKAVVTYFDPVAPDMFLQDASGAVWVKWSPGLPKPSIGSVVELEGVTTFSDFAPDIGNPRWTVVGRAPMPAPKRVTYEQMASTSEDSQWVEVEGIVRQAEYLHRSGNERVLWMDLAIAGGRIDLAIPWDGTPTPTRLVDARIRVNGVCGAEFSAKDQLVGVQLYVPSLDNISILEPAEPYPFNEPTTPVGRLQRYGFHSSIGHRVKLAGQVTASLPGQGFYMADDSGSLYVASRQGIALSPGDRIETLGFIGLADSHVRLEDAVTRKTGDGPEPPAKSITVEQAMSGEYDSELVALRGSVVGAGSFRRNETLLVQQKQAVFSISLPPTMKELPAEGSLVEASGICVNDVDALGRVNAVRLVARSPRDLKVLRTPSWLTARYAANVVGLLAAAIAVVMAWVLVLRRRVSYQTRVISQKLEQEENLKKAAEMASRAKSEFVANMSHEIRTPMNAILGFTDLLLGTPIDNDQEDYLKTIQFSSQALLRILNDILDFEKIEAGGLRLESAPFSIRNCAEIALQVIEPEAARKGLAISLRVEKGVPDAVRGDPHRLHQVLLNLLGNALKFTERGSIVLTVGLRERTASDAEFQFTVADTGIGIPPEAQNRIFESFQQVDGSTTRKYGGTGLGLAICTRLVHLFSGAIWVESEVGAGSKFRFTAWFHLDNRSEGPPFEKESGTREDSSATCLLSSG